MDWFHVALAVVLAANAIGWGFMIFRVRALLQEMRSICDELLEMCRELSASDTFLRGKGLVATPQVTIEPTGFAQHMDGDRVTHFRLNVSFPRKR